MIGHIIDGRYQIESLIGRGGMGAVYQALDLTENQAVAVKVLHAGLAIDTAPTRFYREFRVLTRLDHPHIVKAYGYGSHRQNPYLILELLPGETLQETLQQGVLSRNKALQIGRQITEALIHLHARGIVHRDLKPGNLMVLPSDKLPHIKLMDFGLVRLNEQSVQLTQEGSTLGTLTYMSPEQAQGFSIDFRADLYALGIILYEMVAGRPPFVHENQATVLLQQITAPPLSPRHYNPDIDEPLAQFILKLLNKNPDDRPASTQLVANHLAHLLDETVVPSEGAPRPADLMPAIPLIGREEPLTSLREVWGATCQGQGQVVMMPGPVGIGKGRIITEFKRLAAIPEKQFLRGRNQEHGSLPYQPFIDFLATLINRFTVAVRQTLSPELSRLLPRIDDLPRSPATATQSDARLQLFAACWDVLQRVAEETPLALVVEDLQWANPTTLELVSYLTQRIKRVPILLLFTYRRDEVTSEAPLRLLLRDLERNTAVSTITLPPLTRPQVSAYLRVALGRERIPDWLIDSFHVTTGGNPLFIEETLKVLAAEGRMADWHGQDSSRVTTFNSQPSITLQLPQSVLALAERRLQTIPNEQKTILTTAAVLGSEFSFDLLQAVAQTDEDSLIDAVDWFIASRIIEELPMRDGEDLYRFTEEYMRQALLNNISRRRLRLLHRRSGDAISDLYDSELPRYWPMLAYHYAEAGKYEEAIDYFLRAGDAAARVYAYAEAVTYYTAAIDLGEQVRLDDEQIHRLYSQRGRNLELNGQFEAAMNNYEKLGELAREKGSRALELSAIMACATIRATPTPVHDTQRGRELSEMGLALARQLGDRKAEAKALWNLMLSSSSSNTDAAIAYGEQSVALARELNLKEQLAFTLNDLHWPYIMTGQPEKAKAAWKEAQPLWRALNNMHMLSDNLTNAAGSSLLSGDLEMARQLADEAYEVSKSIGNPWGQAYSRWPIEYYWLEKGEPEKVIDCMEEAIELAEQAGLMPPQITTLSDMAWVFAWLGDMARGLRIAEEARHKAETLLPGSKSYTDAFLARVHLMAGRIDEAATILADYQTVTIHNVSSLGPVWIMIATSELAIAQAEYEVALTRLDALEKALNLSKVRLYLPDVFNLKGMALSAQQLTDEAEQAWRQAYDHAAAMGSRRNMWPALVGLRRIAIVRGDKEKAARFRLEALALVEHIADHAGKINLRDTFMKVPFVQALR